MTDQEILEKAVDKALANGWDAPYDMSKITVQKGHMRVAMELSEYLATVVKPTDYIYRHDFAKALWGEEPYAQVRIPHPDYETGEALLILTNWQFRLSRMVIAPDPIIYLGENT